MLSTSKTCCYMRLHPKDLRYGRTNRKRVRGTGGESYISLGYLIFDRFESESCYNVSMIQKICSRCKQRLSLDSFTKDRHTPDGLNRACKSCNKLSRDSYRSRDREKFLDMNNKSLKRRRAEKYKNVENTGGTCTRCGVSGGPELFYTNRNSSTGRDSWCKDCRRTYANTRNKMYSYGLSEQELDSLLEISGGRCEICGKEGRLYIDHDHESGTVRGMLCPGCNFGLGHFKDSIENLERAIQYLRK